MIKILYVTIFDLMIFSFTGKYTRRTSILSQSYYTEDNMAVPFINVTRNFQPCSPKECGTKY